MAYANRTMHDADSHIYEDFDWHHPYVDAATLTAIPRLWEESAESETVGIDAETATASPAVAVSVG